MSPFSKWVNIICRVPTELLIVITPPPSRGGIMLNQKLADMLKGQLDHEEQHYAMLRYLLESFVEKKEVLEV